MKKLVVGNWKCNPSSLPEAVRNFKALSKGVKKSWLKKTEVAICPPFVFLPEIFKSKSGFAAGAQDCFWEKEGAFTGEVSASMIKSLKCKYVILGHSERRTLFSETNETVNKKVKAVLSSGLVPILCVGETSQQREKGETKDVLEKMLKEGMKGIKRAQAAKIVLAYEPVWAIGTGKACPVQEAQSMGLLLRRVISKIYGKKASLKIMVLYGGSVSKENAREYVKEAGFSGLLAGGASLKPVEFAKIVEAASC
jgi:triosephosphate isomerase